jgi:hypothetical protein
MSKPRSKPRILRVNGTIEEVMPANGKHFKLEEIYKIIGTGGLVTEPFAQEVPLRSKGELMYCEENAIEHNLPANPQATMYTALDVYTDRNGVRGDVLICHPNYIE